MWNHVVVHYLRNQLKDPLWEPLDYIIGYIANLQPETNVQPEDAERALYSQEGLRLQIDSIIQHQHTRLISTLWTFV